MTTNEWAEAESPPKPTNWLDTCLKSDTGKPLPVLANVMKGLRADYGFTFAYDEMRCATVFLESHIAVSDTDITKFQESFQVAGLRRIGSETMFDAIKLHSRENSFHPIREYLADLEWDGKFRVSSWLSAYLGAEE